MPTCGSSFSERTETRGRWRWKSATSPTSLSASRWTHSASRISSAWEISPKYASGTTTQVSRPDVPSLCLVGWLNQLFLTVMLKSLSHCLFDLDETWKLTALRSCCRTLTTATSLSGFETTWKADTAFYSLAWKVAASLLDVFSLLPVSFVFRSCTRMALRLYRREGWDHGQNFPFPLRPLARQERWRWTDHERTGLR